MGWWIVFFFVFFIFLSTPLFDDPRWVYGGMAVVVLACIGLMAASPREKNK